MAWPFKPRPNVDMAIDGKACSFTLSLQIGCIKSWHRCSSPTTIFSQAFFSDVYPLFCSIVCPLFHLSILILVPIICIIFYPDHRFFCPCEHKDKHKTHKMHQIYMQILKCHEICIILEITIQIFIFNLKRNHCFQIKIISNQVSIQIFPRSG